MDGAREVAAIAQNQEPMSTMPEQQSVGVVENFGVERQSEPAESGSTPEGSRFQNLLRWATKGGLAIVDQGLISGANFLLGILLARWLAPDQYGAYALAFSAFLLLSFLYYPLLLEPMAVFSGSAYSRCLRGYLKSLVWIHVAITVVTVVVLGAAAFVAFYRHAPGGLPGALLGVTIASPCILLFWLARRAYYMELAPARAATGALLYCVLVVSGTYFLFRVGRLSPFTAYVLMATGALTTGLYLMFHIRNRLPALEAGPTPRETWTRHWSYGRWALAAAIATWIPYYMYYPLVTSFFGMAQAGQLRALMNFALPMEQTFTALSCLFLPYAARIQARQGRGSAGLLTRRITAIYVVGALAYWLIFLPFKAQAFHFLYAGKYTEVAYLIPYVALETILWSASFGPAIVLRAMESSISIFYARCVASVLSLAVGIPLTHAYGLWGAMVGIVLANAAALVVTLYILRSKIAEGRPVSAVQPEIA
jgi:O-antigen/teichoic acid export membrane protein